MEEKVEILRNSLYKNIEEFTEFIVDNFDITNYYDLVEFIIDLNNFKFSVFLADTKLHDNIVEDLAKEK